MWWTGWCQCYEFGWGRAEQAASASGPLPAASRPSRAAGLRSPETPGTPRRAARGASPVTRPWTCRPAGSGSCAALASFSGFVFFRAAASAIVGTDGASGLPQQGSRAVTARAFWCSPSRCDASALWLVPRARRSAAKAVHCLRVASSAAANRDHRATTKPRTTRRRRPKRLQPSPYRLSMRARESNRTGLPKTH